MSKKLFTRSSSSSALNIYMKQSMKLPGKLKIHTKILPNRISSLLDHSQVLKQSKGHSNPPVQRRAHTISKVPFAPNKLVFSSSSPSENHSQISKAFSRFIQSQTKHRDFLKKVQTSYEEYINYLKENPSMTRDTKEDSLEAAEEEIRRLRSREQYYKNLKKSLQKKSMPKIQVPVASAGFHEEFMTHYSEFSESWRQQIDKNLKRK